MILEKAKSKFQIKFAILLFIAYFILPITGELFLPENFYLFSDSHNLIAERIYYASFFILIFSYFIFYFNNELKYKIIVPLITKKVLFLLFITFSILIFVILINGMYIRLTIGADRNYLLEDLHKFLFSGVSFIFVGGLIYIGSFMKRNIIFIFIFIFILLDILYMGKKFTFYAIALLFFYYDSINSTTNKKFYTIVLIGVIMVVSTYIIRAYVSSDVDIYKLLFSFYGITSEFLGVYSTIGYALENVELINNNYINVVHALYPYYIDSVGHGLALHPLAYFIIVFGEFWLFFIAIYFMFIYILFRIFSSIIGNLVMFIFIINIIHFFRHGPEIFLKQFITQLIFISLLYLLPRIHSTKAKN
jgi:hypothetical protein